MAEIFIVVCDACEKDGRRNEATETIKVVIDSEPIRLDVCAEHAAHYGAILREIKDLGYEDQTLAAVKRLPRSRQNPSPRRTSDELIKAPGATGCPVCFKLLSTPGNAGHHVRKIHLRKIDEWNAEERERATARARSQLAREINGDDHQDRHLSTVPHDS